MFTWIGCVAFCVAILMTFTILLIHARLETYVSALKVGYFSSVSTYIVLIRLFLVQLRLFKTSCSLCFPQLSAYTSDRHVSASIFVFY